MHITKSDKVTDTLCGEGVPATRLLLFALVAAHPFRLFQHVAFHSALTVCAAGAGIQIKIGVQGEQFEEVAVRFSGRRTGSTIAHASEASAALAADVGLFGFGYSFRQLARTCGNGVENPMSEGA